MNINYVSEAFLIYNKATKKVLKLVNLIVFLRDIARNGVRPIEIDGPELFSNLNLEEGSGPLPG